MSREVAKKSIIDVEGETRSAGIAGHGDRARADAGHPRHRDARRDRYAAARPVEVEPAVSVPASRVIATAM
jgi:hypothetical protein